MNMPYLLMKGHQMVRDYRAQPKIGHCSVDGNVLKLALSA